MGTKGGSEDEGREWGQREVRTKGGRGGKGMECERMEGVRTKGENGNEGSEDEGRKWGQSEGVGTKGERGDKGRDCGRRGKWDKKKVLDNSSITNKYTQIPNCSYKKKISLSLSLFFSLQ